MIRTPRPINPPVPTKMYESFLEMKRSKCHDAPITFKHIYYSNGTVEDICLCHECGEHCVPA